LFPLYEQFGFLETQYSARATSHAFSASQAIRILDFFAQPYVTAHIYANGTIKRADPALNATGWLRNNLSGDKGFMTTSFVF
jgi:hypothetical protein